MVQVLKDVMSDAKTLLTAVVGVMAIWFVVWTWARTRSVVPVLGAVLVGAVVLFGVQRMDLLRDEVKEDVTNYSNNKGPRLGGG